MILEVAVLHVRAGEPTAFEAAFAEAQRFQEAAPGYLGHELQRCLDAPGKYVLLVRWVSVDHHESGFRGSPDYQSWRRLLHHFYDPFPTVEHYERVAGPGLGEAPR